MSKTHDRGAEGPPRDPAAVWSAYFTGVALDSWRAAHPPAVTRAEADFIASVLDLKPGARLLDVPCGDGRLLLRLAAAAGVTGIGVDCGADQIAAAQRQAQNRALGISFEARDMRDLPWADAFDAAICFGNSFGYFADTENGEFLAAVHRALAPGGCFLLDTRHVVDSLPPPFAPRTTYRTGNIRVLLEQRYDAASRRVDSLTTFALEGRVEKRSCSYRVYGYAELCALVAGAGFAALRGYADLRGRPYRSGAHRLLLVATKARAG